MPAFMKHRLILASLSILLGCTTNSTFDTSANMNWTLESCEISHDDSYAITNVAVEDNRVNIGVSYSGGCEPHDWELCWNGDVAESSPIQVFLDLGHNANGDSCEMEKTETLSFDISILDDVEKPTTIVVGGSTVTYGAE